jgi:hypothetical protein
MLADQDKASVSWVVRRAIEDYLRRHPQPGGRPLPVRPAQKRERRVV